MIKKTLLVAMLAATGAGAQAEEIGASVTEVERWSTTSQGAALELTLTDGQAQTQRVLFVNDSDATIELFDLTMTSVLRIKPRQTVDMSRVVEGLSMVAVAVEGGPLVYVDVKPGMSLKASATEEDPS